MYRVLLFNSSVCGSDVFLHSITKSGQQKLLPKVISAQQQQLRFIFLKSVAIIRPKSMTASLVTNVRKSACCLLGLKKKSFCLCVWWRQVWQCDSSTECQKLCALFWHPSMIFLDYEEKNACWYQIYISVSASIGTLLIIFLLELSFIWLFQDTGNLWQLSWFQHVPSVQFSSRRKSALWGIINCTYNYYALNN